MEQERVARRERTLKQYLSSYARLPQRSAGSERRRGLRPARTAFETKGLTLNEEDSEEAEDDSSKEEDSEEVEEDSAEEEDERE